MGWGMSVPSAGLFTVLTKYCLSFFVTLSIPAHALVQASEKLLTCLFVFVLLSSHISRWLVMLTALHCCRVGWVSVSSMATAGPSMRSGWPSLQLLLMGLAPALLALSSPQPGLPPAALRLSPEPASASAVLWPQHFPCPHVPK